MTNLNKEVVVEFERMCNDEGIPQNIKVKMESIVSMLSDKETTAEFKTNKALQELDEISEENNVPEHLRTQIWSLVSILESLN
jgi:uncharacterized protein (UPF0147 family)